MSEYSYEINGYTVGIDKSEKQDETALCIMRQIEDKVIVEGTLHGRLASFVDSILQENIMLKNDFIPKIALVNYLRQDIKETKQEIKYWEEQYRIARAKKDEFYKNSYKRQINRWQSRFETLKEILEFIEGEKK